MFKKIGICFFGIILFLLLLFLIFQMPVIKGLVFKKKQLANPITLYMINGNSITGDLISEDANSYLIKWENGEVRFLKSEVHHEQRGTAKHEDITLKFQEQEKNEWPYQNRVVIQLTNAEILDVAIIDVQKNTVTVQTILESGGKIEQTLNRSQIERLLFKPVDDEKTRLQEENLKKLFPKMKFYREGNFTIVTDSYITWVREYKKTLRMVYADFYFNFFPLLRNRQPSRQNFIIIFDDHADFIEYAVSDSVPGWMVLGYFSPIEKNLYLFNTLGDRFSEYIRESMGTMEKTIDDLAKDVIQQYGERNEVFIKGQATDIKNKYWSFHDVIVSQFRQRTLQTLRHEFIHGLFNNWGLQSVMVSKLHGNKDILIEKKREFLEAKTPEEKRKMLMGLLDLQRKDYKDLKMDAANSWFVEGLAVFCETDPCGKENEGRLFTFQKMMQENKVFPLEQLTVYKMGSFPGVYPEVMLDAYAQSWAFVFFLMHEYPSQFLAYQERMAAKKSEGNQDLEWLLEELRVTDIRKLQNEFVNFMKQYPTLEDPDLELLDTFLSIANRT